MQWWLTVFFLLGNSWVSGDLLDGWSSRAYTSETECEMRRQFAERQTARYPLDAPSRWLCNRGHPAAIPPSTTLDVKLDSRPSPRTHWHSPAIPLGLEIFTTDELPWMAKDGVGLRYTGPLRRTFAEELRRLLLATPQQYNHVVLELDSDGGELDCVKEIVSVLQDVRSRMELTTRVVEGSLCASGCIPVFMQGKKRKASGSSIWVFHGARSAFTNVPDPAATENYLDMLSMSGMEPEFRAMLELENRIHRPGNFILSGYELFAVYHSGIITELIPFWREDIPISPSELGPH